MITSFSAWRLTLFCCAIVLFSFAVQGQIKPKTIEDFQVVIKKGSPTTYSDLIDLVFPETGDDTRKSVPLNNIFGDYKDQIYEGKLEVSYAQAVWVSNNGVKQLLLLMDLMNERELFTWGEMNVLALFDVRGKPKLVNAVDVQADRFAFFSEQQPILNINAKTDAFLIANHHFNAGEGFVNLTLLSMVNNHFKIILDDIPTLMNENHCGANYDEKAFLTLVPNPRSTYRNITVNLKHARHPDEPECERKRRGYTKNYWYRFTWNNKRAEYVKLKGKN